MSEERVIYNKVAESSLITINPEDFYPKDPIVIFDLKDFLFMGLILKEKDFRADLMGIDWELYRNKNVAVTCSADAIIPVWAFMLIASYLQPVATNMVLGNREQLIDHLILRSIEMLKAEEYSDKRVVIKGCGELAIPESAYLEITARLLPFVKSIMYGEPCSTVPVFKRK